MQQRIHENPNDNVPCLVVDEEVDPLPHLCPARAGPAGVLADVEVRRLANVEGGDVREAAVICQRRTKTRKKLPVLTGRAARGNKLEISLTELGNWFVFFWRSAPAVRMMVMT